MFSRLLSLLKGVIRKLIPYKDIEQVEHIESPLSPEMINALDEWYLLYLNVDYPTKIKAAGLNGYAATQTEPVKPQPDPEPDKSIDELAQEVLSGKWGNGEDRKNRLTEAGYDYSAVQAKVNELVGATPQPAKKTVAELAQEVLSGKWGNGVERKEKLTAAGYDYSAVQAKVNELVNGKTDITPKKSVSEIAKEVIKGDWGNGADRKNRLTAAGYNYAVIQAEVNKQLNE